MRKEKLDVICIGGSISGLAAAAVLTKQGHRVHVFEKRGEELSAQGAGLALPVELVEKLKTIGIISELQTLPITKRFFMACDQKQPQAEKIIWEQAVSAKVLHWSEIYHQLRKKIPNDCYHLNSEIIDIESTADHATVTLANDKKMKADLAICADGSSSLYRKKTFPDVQKSYAGYVAWRGITETGDYLKKRFQKTDEEAFYYYGTSEGHLLIYPILYGKQKRLNWVLYQRCSQSELRKLLTDDRGIEHKSSLLPGDLSQDARAKLQQHAMEDLPTEAAQIICLTKAPFLQVMYTLKMPSSISQRLVFIGDASAIYLPHIGSASAKAIKDALLLAEFLTNSQSLDSAVQKWNVRQKIESDDLHVLSHAMGTHMVMQPPEWQNMNPEKMLKWWSENIMGNNKSWYITHAITKSNINFLAHNKSSEQKEPSSDNPALFIQSKL